MCTFGVEFIHFAMIEKLQGVVLRTIKYNDKNAIVRVYTDMHGVMAFLLPQGNGKVARQRRALFQPLSLVEIVADIRQGRDLYSIKEAGAGAQSRAVFLCGGVGGVSRQGK